MLVQLFSDYDDKRWPQCGQKIPESFYDQDNKFVWGRVFIKVCVYKCLQ